ncbi:hypothetical protein BdWA1_003420 [Babesia duncani]|uniref:Uncharacterized protein n=1 Tax=Babesia duncani TaxID=323732 RepID=A0AAD9PIP0_9APIC|nr:hypothetical protein BdWA1_003420 [Babesia duncani]
MARDGKKNTVRSRACTLLQIPIYRVLESQMGDPVLSHWIGADGVVAGTALGRVAAYIFDCPTFELMHGSHAPNNQSISNDDSIPLVDIESGSVSARDQYSPRPNNDSTEGVKASFLNAFNFLKIRQPEKTRLHKDLPGRYTVFASFSDEAIRACFIHKRLLYCMVGTSSIAIYDVDAYTLKAVYQLHIERRVGYQQIAFAKDKILIDSMRTTTILDPITQEQRNPLQRLYPSNVLDFNGNAMVCYHKNYKDYLVQVFFLDNDGGGPRFVKYILIIAACPSPSRYQKVHILSPMENYGFVLTISKLIYSGIR